jgi:hypothetical protein
MHLFSVAFILAVATTSNPARAFISPASTAPFVTTKRKDLLHYLKKSRHLQMSSDAGTPPEVNLNLDPKETAVVLIEYQNEFATNGGKLHDAVKEVMSATDMLANSKKLMDECRAAGCHIVHVPISFDKVRRETPVCNNPTSRKQGCP